MPDGRRETSSCKLRWCCNEIAAGEFFGCRWIQFWGGGQPDEVAKSSCAVFGLRARARMVHDDNRGRGCVGDAERTEPRLQRLRVRPEHDAKPDSSDRELSGRTAGLQRVRHAALRAALQAWDLRHQGQPAQLPGWLL